MELAEQVAEAGTGRVTWTRLTVRMGRGYPEFDLWKAERDGVTACGPSPEAARARLAKLETG